MFRALALVIGIVAASSAQAKISYFSQSDVLKHVLQSKEFSGLHTKYSELSGTDLYDVQISNTGDYGAGAVFTLDLEYSSNPSRPSIPLHCNVKITVENELTKHRGISATALSVPKVQKPVCAQ